MRVIGKLLILLLVFCIGFVSAFGALFGVGYYAYKNVSLDKAGVSTDSIFDKSIAEVDISNMTIEGLVSEIQALQGISDKLTLDTLISRYGVIVPEEVDSAIPVSARTLPLHQLFSQDGLMIILGDLYIGQLLSYEKGELKPGTDGEYYWYQPGTTNEVTGIYSVLVNYTVADLINQNFDVNMIMEDLTIATVLNLHDVTYSEAYIDGSAVTLEKEVRVWFNSDGAKVSSTIAALADIPVSKLSTSLDGVEVSSLLGYVEYSDDYYSYTTTNMDNKDVLVLTEQGGLTAELSDMTIADFSNGKIDEKINEIEIYTVLGYTYDEEDGKYYDQNGEAATGVTAVIAGFAIGEVGSEINNVMIGEVCGFTKVEVLDKNGEPIIDENGEVQYKWYSTYSEEEPSLNEEAEGIMAAMADLTINDLGDNDKLTDRINSVTVADALGYKETEDGFVDKNGDPVTGVIGVIAGEPLGGIQDKIDETEVGELCGYTKVGDDWYTTDEDGSERKVTGVMAAIADSTVDTIDQDIDNVLIGDVCGYISVKDDDGNVTWYTKYNGEDAEDNELATGVMGALASSSIGTIDEDINNVHIGEVCGYTKKDGVWYTEDEDGNEVEAAGVMATMADLTIEQLGDDDAVTARVETITVADALGYELDEDGEGYVDKNGEPVTGVMGVLAGTQLVNIQSKVDDTMVGELCGFTRVHVSGEGEDAVYKWYSEYDEKHPENNVEATGVMAVMVDLKVSELKDDSKITAKIETITVADALGYKPDASGDGYVDKNGDPVIGVMGVIAGTKLNGIQGTVDEATIGEVTGFTKIGDTWYTDPEGTEEAGGIMNAIADLKVSELKEDGKLTECIEGLTVADALGYELSEDGETYVDKYDNPVTGVMGVIAGQPLNDIQGAVDDSLTGELMGLTPVYAEDGETITSWKDDNGEPVHVLMNKIASTPFDEISGITDTLVISDIIPEEERDHGFISLINPNATIDQIPDEVDKLFNETEICKFVEAGVITFDKEEHTALFDEDGPFGHHSMTDLIGILAGLLHSQQQLGQQSE